MTELFTMLVSGNILQAIIESYTGIMGDWFWVLYLGLGFIMIYLKNKDFVSTALIALAIFPAISPLILPDAFRFFYLFFAIAISVVIYKVMH